MIPTTGHITMDAHLVAIDIRLGTAEASDWKSWTEGSIVEATT
jgi:hypothetical protein